MAVSNELNIRPFKPGISSACQKLEFRQIFLEEEENEITDADISLDKNEPDKENTSSYLKVDENQGELESSSKASEFNILKQDDPSNSDFKDRITLESLKLLENEFNAALRDVYNFPFLVNTVCYFKNSEKTQLLLQRIDMIEEYIKNGFNLKSEKMILCLKFLLSISNFKRALSFCMNIRDKYENNLDIKYFTALCQYHSGKYDDALSTTGSILETDANMGFARYLRAVCYFKLERQDEFIKDLKFVFDLMKDNRAYLRFAAAHFERAGELEILAKVYKALLLIEDNSANWNTKLGNLLYTEEEFLRAIPYLESESVSETHYDFLNYMEAVAYYHIGKNDIALEYFKAFLKTGQNETESLIQVALKIYESGLGDEKIISIIAELYLNEGNFTSCYDMCTSTRSGGVQNRVALILSQCYISQKKYDQALGVLKDSSIDIVSLVKDREFLTGLCYFHLEDFEESKRCFQRVVEFVQDENSVNTNGGSNFYLGEISYSQKDYSQAVSYFKNSLALGYKLYESALRLAYASLKADMMLVAQEAFIEVIRIDPGCQDAMNNLGIILAKSGQFDKAIKYFKDVLNINPLNKEAHYNLGLAYEQILKTRSREHYEYFINAENELEGI